MQTGGHAVSRHASEGTRIEACTIYVDARCYQDHNYALRGIGRSTISLLRNCPPEFRGGLRLVAVLDPNLGPLVSEYVSVFDDTCFDLPLVMKDTILFSPSPLTHRADFIAAMVRNPHVLKTAFVHDFIPYDFRGEFGDLGEYVQYSLSLDALKQYDLFFANSQYTARRTCEILGISKDRVHVSRIAARNEFFETEHVLSQAEEEVIRSITSGASGYFVCVSGDAPRKRPELAVEALQQVNASVQANYILMLVGKFGEGHRQRLTASYPGHVVFLDKVSDRVLAWLNNKCIAAVQPSRVEGFSMPIVEAIVSGGLVIGSNCEAHCELIGEDELLFEVDNSASLASIMLRATQDLDWRSRMIARLRARSDAQNTEVSTAKSFWDLLLARLQQQRKSMAPSPSVSRAAKPAFAFVSPYPPHKSGVAIATARGVAPLFGKAHVDLFTHANVGLEQTRGFRKVGGLSDAATLRDYQAVVYVLGNCIIHHGPIYDLARDHRCGDFVLLADSVMINMQYDKRGPHGAAAYASSILKREVTPGEFEGWLGRPQTSAILGLEEFLDGNWTPIVHSRVTQRVFRDRFGVDPIWVPHSNKIIFGPDDFSSTKRREWRERLGYRDAEITIVSAGGVSEVKGAYESILAVRELHDWGQSARLVFAGGADKDLQRALEEFAVDIGVGESVVFTSYIPDEDYRFHILAADVGLQLRKVPFGQTSGGLCDCISLGLPSVANLSMAEAIDAPSYVTKVPDVLSPILIAEAILEAYDSPQKVERDSDLRREYVRTHAPETFAEAFLNMV